MASALRRALLAGVLRAERAEEALQDYLDLPLTRHGHEALVGRVLELRDNFSSYAATYGALAEALNASLLTADIGLARAVADMLAISTVPGR